MYMVMRRCVVEFSREDGTTIAWFSVQQNEVKPYTESDVLKAMDYSLLLLTDKPL